MDDYAYDRGNTFRRTCYVYEGKEPDENESVRIVYIDAHPPAKIPHKGVILLIHGFPSTSHQYHKVAPLLTQAGYRLIIPDYRGAGDSSKPITPNGYRKTRMAADLHYLVTHELGIKVPIHVVGHDIGALVAHAYAAQYASDVASLTWGECPLPGTSTYEEYKATIAVWHFLFHRVTDLPEALIAGKERAYIKYFFDKQAYNHAALTSTDMDVYERAYSLPGAIRAGLNIYRVFEDDAKDNIDHREKYGKSKVRCFMLNGANFFVAASGETMAREFYENFEVDTISNSGHYVAEENPEEFVTKILAFIGKT